MAERFGFIVMLQIETGDPRLTEDALAVAMETPHSVAVVRRAILQHLPKDVTRLVAIMPIAEAQQIMTLHEAVSRLEPEGGFGRPPADYVPPTVD